MRRATDADLPAIRALLGANAEFAMFPLNNLSAYGFEREDDFSVRFFVTAGPQGVTDVLTLTRGGMAMPFLPSGDFDAAARAITGEPLIGIIGPRDHVRGLEAAARLRDVPRTLDHDEPHFVMSLDRLIVPEGQGAIYPMVYAPEETIRGWLRAYQVEALNTPEDEIEGRVERSYKGYADRASHVVMMENGVALAMTGFNASLPDIVQIGGVYTPPELRGRGYARRALALHLEQVRAQGVSRATLFSASDMAARAYRGIGFGQIGMWTLLLFRGPQTAQ